MPAALVPHAAIPELAARVTSEMLKILRHIQKADFIMNGEELTEILPKPSADGGDGLGRSWI